MAGTYQRATKKRARQRQGKLALAKRVREFTEQGLSASRIAERTGLSRRYIFELRRLAVEPASVILGQPDPRKLEEITDPEVLRCLVDNPEGFQAFFNRYSPYTPYPGYEGLPEELHGEAQRNYDAGKICCLPECGNPALYRWRGQLVCYFHAHHKDGSVLKELHRLTP